MKTFEVRSSSQEQTKDKAMTKDPICGMTVDEATALRAEREGETFYFCSEHCRKKFLSQSAPATSDGDCCGGAKAKPSGASGDCCGSKDEHADRTTTIPITVTTTQR
jgi:YHS domain-containing protein